jgi:hypothetical protein
VFAGCDTLRFHLVARNANRTSGRSDEPSQQLHGCRLTSAIGSQKGANLTAGHNKANIIDRGKRAIKLTETLGLDHQTVLVAHHIRQKIDN